MKRRYRQNQIITIIALVVVMLGVSVGFAAFSNVLTIGTTAAVKPDSSTFSVLFSSSNTSQTAGSVVGTGSGGASAGSASISGTTISGLKANFTAPGQSVTYTFYAHNVGGFVAYLRSISFGTGKSCTAGTNTSGDMVNAACDDISVIVTVGDVTATEYTDVYGHALAKDAYETVTVQLMYSSNGDVADGDFSVTFGDVSLEYSSVDGVKEISFGIRSRTTGDYYTYRAVEGMTWSEWLESDYNISNDEYTWDVVQDGSALYVGHYLAADEWIIVKHENKLFYVDEVINADEQYVVITMVD